MLLLPLLVAHSTAWQAYGAYSGLYSPDNGPDDGLFFQVDISSETNMQWAGQAVVKGEAGQNYQIYFLDTDLLEKLATTTWQSSGSGEEQTVTGALAPGTEWDQGRDTWSTLGYSTLRFYITKNNEESYHDFYVDGVQVEAKGYATTYCDGDQTGCEWTATEHASTSTRDARSRAGGRIYNLGDATLKITELHGAGMPPVRLLSQDQPLLPGALYQRTKIQPRLLTFTFVARVAGDTTTYHSARSSLLSYLKPDEVT
jgi:hypothetical protein